jgi:polar amino acid transport system permease protein
VPPILLGIVIFGIHYATYMAEVYRAGIDAVPAGQWEAATALSMSRGRTWVAVIIPQALRSTIPALGNYVISMFKDTPFLSVITITELVRQAQLYGGQNFRYTEAIILAGLIYLVASYVSSLLIGRLEKRLVLTH